MSNVNLTRKFLKCRLLKDPTTLHGYQEERNHIKDLFYRTSKIGESNSALLISPKSCGKTTLVNSVLLSLLSDEHFFKNTLIISLNGLIHTDDRLALKEATTQMNLDSAVGDKVFGSFSENLAFLLSCLKTVENTKSLIFIIEEFDLFCAHHNQTLLYNLFDVAQSAQTPICVLGVTCRLDVVELLEKRVKSRFSHRQIFLLPDNNNFDGRMDLFKELLKLPETQDLEKYVENNPALPSEVLENCKLVFLRRLFDPTEFEFPQAYIKLWNNKINILASNQKVQKSLEFLYDYEGNISSFKRFLSELVSELDDKHQFLKAEDIIERAERELFEESKVLLICGLSVLEICLLISIKHHCEIYDNDPFNFEIILGRYQKFANKSSSMQGLDREVVLKGFENLKFLEFIVAIGAEGKVQKEYQMHKMLILPTQIDKAISKYQNLPTEVGQWSKSSIL
ncbi:unnamed protein product [Diamesa serratosioi]